MNICLCCGAKTICGCSWRVTADELNSWSTTNLEGLREQAMNHGPDRKDEVHDCTAKSSCMNIVRAIDVILERRKKQGGWL